MIYRLLCFRLLCLRLLPPAKEAEAAKDEDILLRALFLTRLAFFVRDIFPGFTPEATALPISPLFFLTLFFVFLYF
jgi:hypothetical protein